MKNIKEFFAVPFYGLFVFGCAIAMLGWIFVELLTEEKIKEIKIIKNEASTEAPGP